MGTAETVGRLGNEDLRAYHRQYFVPQNMVVTLFGDIDPDQAAGLVRQHFGSLPPAADFQPPAFDRPNQIANNIIRHKQTRKPTGMVILSYPGTSIRQQPDHAAMTVLDALVSGYSFPGGWLHNELRGARLVYYVPAFPIAGPAPGYFAVLAQTWSEKTGEVVDRIQRNLQQARAGQIAEDEFETAKQTVIALHAQENTTLAEQARQAALDALYGLGFDYGWAFDGRISAVARGRGARGPRVFQPLRACHCFAAARAGAREAILSAWGRLRAVFLAMGHGTQRGTRGQATRDAGLWPAMDFQPPGGTGRSSPLPGRTTRRV